MRDEDLSTSSPLVPDGSSGFILFRFDIHGTLTADQSTYSAERALVGMSLNNGPVFGILTAVVGRAQNPLINSSTAAPAGFTFGPSSLSGSATFDSFLFPIVFGAPTQLKVGLLAEQLGTGSADFGATVSHILLFDGNQNPIGELPGSQAPEPASIGLGCIGAVCLVLRRLFA